MKGPKKQLNEYKVHRTAVQTRLTDLKVRLNEYSDIDTIEEEELSEQTMREEGEALRKKIQAMGASECTRP